MCGEVWESGKCVGVGGRCGWGSREVWRCRGGGVVAGGCG